MKEAQLVEKVRAQRGISYGDALRVVRLAANNQNSSTDASKNTSRYTPLPNLPLTSSNEPRTWAQRVKPQHNHSVQSVSTGTQTQDSLTPSTLQGITVNKFVELMCKIISLCNNTENIDIVKIVTDLTKETLQCDSPNDACTNVPVSADVVPQPDSSTKTAQCGILDS